MNIYTIAILLLAHCDGEPEPTVTAPATHIECRASDFTWSDPEIGWAPYVLFDETPTEALYENDGWGTFDRYDLWVVCPRPEVDIEDRFLCYVEFADEPDPTFDTGADCRVL